MARNGSGTYSNPYPNFISGTVISSSEVDANNSDIATALTQSIAVDGQSVVTGDIPLATHKFTAMKVGTAATDSLSLGQAQAEAFVWCGTAGGGADAITLSPSPAITAYAAGQRFVWIASGSTNTGATTVAISGLGTIALQDNGAALTAGQHAAGKMFMGILNTTSTVQIMNVQVSGTDPLIVSSLTVTGDATIGDDLTLLSDASILGFGEHTDVTVTHVADSGLTFKNTSTADDTPFVLLVQTGETDIALDDALGKIQFQAPDEAAGTDSRLVAAEIAAVSEGDFSASNNATKLAFKTGASEAATEKMSISSVGNVTMKETETGDDTPMTLLLQTGETDIAANDVLGKIEFQAPDEGAGTDAILVAAAIDAVSEGDFSSSSNATKLSFRTGASETATEKMSLDSAGTLLLTSTLASASVGPNLYLTRTSASPADNDLCGDIIYTADNDAGEDTTLVQMYATLLDASNGSEDASLIIQTVTAGSYVASCQFKGSGIQVPDGGKVGSTTPPTAIDILGTGEIGIGTSGNTAIQTYIYDNTTNHHGIRVQLDNAGSSQYGVYATTDGAGIALYGQCAGAHWGVYGLSAANYGVYAQTQSASYGGCFGLSASGSNYGILGHANTYGVYGTTVHSVGALTKGSGTFLIPHPLKSEIEGEPWSLAHSFIEGPQCHLIYRGRATLVDGQATISLDTKYGMTAGTFEWLTKAEDVQTFTSNETGWDAVKSSFSGDTITIECQNASSTDTISWMVVAERGDPNIISSTITDGEGNLIIERPSEPEPPLPPPPED